VANRKYGRKLGFWYWVAVVILRPPLMLLTKRDWRRTDRLPRGGAVLVPNHISYFDPLTLAHFVHDNRIPVCFLAKAELFKPFFVGQVMKGARQIPVYRSSRNAMSSFRDAVAAVQRGERVIVYPEGTVTRDPGLWPMIGKTGAARVALATGAPVIPIAQWGPQDVLPPYSLKPRFFPRKRIQIQVGPPVDLSAFQGQEITGELLRDATEKIMAAVTEQLELLRGEKGPEERFNMKKNRVPETGNPDQPARDEGGR
jgi:1-acyl-sn-glycerol-3-phosphate acyltransferase